VTVGMRLEKISEVRVVSWNINFRGPKAAKLQGGLLRQLAPNLMLLQEVNSGSSAVLAEAAGADWMVKAIDLRAPERNDTPVRRRGVAIAGRGLPLVRSWLLNQIRLPERILLVEIQMEGTPFIAVSYHAPPGVNWKIIKPQQAVAFASWLCSTGEVQIAGRAGGCAAVSAPGEARQHCGSQSEHQPAHDPYLARRDTKSYQRGKAKP